MFLSSQASIKRRKAELPFHFLFNLPMSRKSSQTEKSQTSTNSRVNPKSQNDETKPTPSPRNLKKISSSSQSAATLIKSMQNNRLTNKAPLAPIPSGKINDDDEYNDLENDQQDWELADESSLPLKLFDGKKQSVAELSEQSMSYVWFRRIKEIFLHMADGKDDQDNDPFVVFDMNLAKADLINTCDRYIENERIALTEKVKKTSLLHTVI